MISIDRANEILDEIAEELPQDFYKELNGGIILSEETKIHPEARHHDLYIMGEYQRNHYIGRSIVIYYGSFSKMYAHRDEAFLREKLREVLLHEFTHHLESLAGLKDLEIEDALNLLKYRKG
ncbi:MAG: metallopeptidase family protein [Eubacteriaceae bacterium]